ncbi:MAG: glycosyl transferase family protein [Alphaproteobacteria bacterium]|nr:glycosyl transferase family protein [Alphaproteobacteria bacterium]
MSEHPFAAYIRILGKGPNLSRSLTEDEALAAGRMILADQVEPIQLGAFLCLLRVKTESPEEIAGIVRAAREALVRPAGAFADLDWPSYAGKARRLPWFLLAARLLSGRGVRILLHGSAEPGSDRLHAESVLDLLDIPRAASLGDAAACLKRRAIAYLPLECMQPRLSALLGLRKILGVRSPFNTALRQLNPFAAPYQMIGVAHPSYRTVHRAAAARLGQPNLAVFKGEGGEAERRPEKPCDAFLLRDGVAAETAFPAVLEGPFPAEDQPLDSRRLVGLWTGTLSDPAGEACVTATAAVALHLLGRAGTPALADAMARAWWLERHRAQPFAA